MTDKFGVPRRFTLRFFIDRETGAVYESNVAIARKGDQEVLWLECDCEQYDDERWCIHVDALHSDFDDIGSFYVAIDDAIPGSEQAVERIAKEFLTVDDASDLRRILLKFGIVEVI